MIYTDTISTPIGILSIQATGKGIGRISFDNKEPLVLESLPYDILELIENCKSKIK